MTGPKAAEDTRILVIEDDPEMTHLFRTILAGQGRSVESVGTAAEATLALSRAPDLAVLDLFLPDGDGRELLRTMRATPGTSRTAVIMIATAAPPDIRSECLALGADAFVEKPLDPAAFVADVDLQLDRARAAAREAHSDVLTGLLNRAGLLDRLGDREGEVGHAVLSAHLDGFERIPERYGWGIAERIVAEIAGSLRSVLPDITLARVSGGEFAALLPTADPASQVEAAEAMVAAVRKLPVEGPDRETFRLTLSVGIAGAQEGEASREVLERAERRAFRAADAGGNRVVAAEEVAPSGPSKILIAEDDDITAKILSHRLEKEGFETVRYANGQEAYKGALEITPALVILDVKMPGMDGFELLEKLRKTPSYAGVPIVMLTSMGSEPDVVRAFGLGADDYIHKPFSPSELTARLRRFLARGRRAAGA